MLVETAFYLVTWFLNHPNSKGHIFITLVSSVMKFAGYGKNIRKFMCTKFGSCYGTIDQDISQSLGVYFIVDTA